ncbi:MAG: hypothetical protein FWC71_11690 [Defluviitaleaceae bacterium]|nr:hypothetical protein [Defluviitaleaceae bacterium]
MAMRHSHKGILLFIRELLVLGLLVWLSYRHWLGAAANNMQVRDEFVGLVYGREVGLSECGTYFSIVLVNDSSYDLIFLRESSYCYGAFFLVSVAAGA